MSKTFGTLVGRGIGRAGALVVEGGYRAAVGAGRFGKDVVEGAEQGYAEERAKLLITRAEGLARREAELAAKRLAHDAAMKPVTMEVVEPVVVKRGRVALG